METLRSPGVWAADWVLVTPHRHLRAKVHTFPVMPHEHVPWLLLCAVTTTALRRTVFPSTETSVARTTRTARLI